MELMGVIVGLESLKTSCDVEVISDSQYVVNAFNKNWLFFCYKKEKQVVVSCFSLFVVVYEVSRYDTKDIEAIADKMANGN